MSNPAWLVVRDHNGQQLAYVYFEDEPGARVAMLRLEFLEAADCRKRRPCQGSARYHHEKRYCS
jgi:hypothetical protein